MPIQTIMFKILGTQTHSLCNILKIKINLFCILSYRLLEQHMHHQTKIDICMGHL